MNFSYTLFDKNRIEFSNGFEFNLITDNLYLSIIIQIHFFITNIIS